METKLTANDADQKISVEHILEDRIAPTTLEAGSASDEGARKLQPPPLVAAMTAEVREQAEQRLKRKIDMRLLPMVILMYIMSKCSWFSHAPTRTNADVDRLPRQKQHCCRTFGRPSG